MTSRKRLKFVFVPLAFFIIGLGLLCLTLYPIMSPYMSMAKLFFLDSAMDFSQSDDSGTLERLNFMEATTVAEAEEDEEEIIDIQSINLPKIGELYGKIKISSAGIDAPVYWGDSAAELNKGVGTYTGAYLPGQNRAVLLGAHNNTYFHTLGEVVKGDEIHFTTTYGQYVYKVTDTKVAEENDESAYDLEIRNENLILYTCYPFDTLGLTPLRFFVYAEFVSGPKMNYIS